MRKARLVEEKAIRKKVSAAAATKRSNTKRKLGGKMNKKAPNKKKDTKTPSIKETFRNITVGNSHITNNNNNNNSACIEIHSVNVSHEEIERTGVG